MPNISILLVDDDSRLRQVIRRLLADHAMSDIVEAGDGQEALGLIEAGGIDLVFTDLVMPRLDGLGLVQALRGAGNSIPIILFSGHADAHTLVLAVKAGVDNYVPKPINPETLIEKIEQTMANRRGEQAA